MGKSKRRSKASRFNSAPLGNKSKSTVKDEALSAKKIQPLLKQLQSAVPNDRAMALGSITVLCEDPHMRKLFLKEKLVHIVLSRLLSDDNMDIVVESHGLLRNLALDEGYDVCAFLWRSDMWTSIISGFAKLQKSLEWAQSNTAPTNETMRQLYEFGDNLLSLIVALANGSDNILEDILKTNKLQEIFGIIHLILEYGLSKIDGKMSLKISASLFNTILDLLYDFSSDSVEFIEAVSQDPYLSEFVKRLPDLQLSAANELSTVLTQGIYLQFLDLDLTQAQANEIIIKACSAIESIDLNQMQKCLSSTEFDNELVNSPNDQVSGKIKEFAKQRALACVHLQSIEVTLDIITASLEIIAAKFGDRNVPLDDELLKTLTVSLPVVFQSLFEEFKSRVLIAWNNMLWLYLTLRINFFVLPNNMWQQLWGSLSMSSSEENSDFGIKLGKLGVTWALLKTLQLQENQTLLLTDLNCDNPGFVDAIKEEYQNVTGLDTHEVQELRQRCCGILSCLAMLPDHIELNRQIGHFLIEQLADKHTSAATLVDISDMLFDIYSDAKYDYDEDVFVKDAFVKILRDTIVPNMKQTFKFVDKNKDHELKAKTKDCLATMERFIEYKLSERK
ncbi:LANO_0H18712g1_1 [Lachancea nothofagi CBS 11611]|uniref:LANO_0H18712g1_1 n=1 Tax=Lachancea nothofagi CBS 11611 TaxID=1266666 RepID=A0A1G4KN23_9SACH|nr:LANO_0H18712g1_1 [Lachancea nothofagi CBS 11611]